MNVTLRHLLPVLLCWGAYAGPAWIRVGREPLEVFTDTGEDKGRDLLRRFDHLRQIFPAVTGKPVNVHTPIRVLCFRSAAEYAPFQPNAQTPGFYQGAPERDMVAMNSSEETSRVALHEFTHALLNHSLSRLPLWLDEGLAELFSTTSAGKRTIQAGAPVPSHLYTLSHETWIPPDQFLNADKTSPYYNRWAQTNLFYAQSWAMAHMLFLSPEYRKATPGYLDRLSQGVHPDIAFSEAFGKPFAAALDDVRAYVKRPWLPRAEVASSAGDSAAIQTFSLTEDQTLSAEIDLLLRLEKTAEARKLLQDAEKRKPSDPRWTEWRARLAIHDDRPEEAEKLFDQAIGTGYASAEAYFESAVLRRDRRADPDDVKRLLERAVERNPQYAEANFLLGKLLFDGGLLADALPHLRRAVEVLPRQVSFWQALATAEWDAGNREAASEAAGQCLNAATTESDFAMAQALIVELSRKPEPPAQPGRVAEPAKPRDVAASGKLERVDCLGAQARIQIRAGGRKLLLLVTDRSQVLQDLRCGDGQNLPASVIYAPSANQELGTTGVVKSLQTGAALQRLEQ